MPKRAPAPGLEYTFCLFCYLYLFQTQYLMNTVGFLIIDSVVPSLAVKNNIIN